ncbi:MAG: hypothetical protein K5841_07000, partial [Fretibacterium sp.]|nr:hypothetical protein [Fretibacterium sp.]
MVPENGVTISECITVSGTVNLILRDGATLKLEKGITVASGKTLNIYAQSGGTGVLIASGEDNAAGIGGGQTASNGTVNIYAGTVTATGGQNGAGIGGGVNGAGGTVTIHGGLVTATGGEGAIGAGASSSHGTLTVKGGTVYGGDSENPDTVISDYTTTRPRYMIVKAIAVSIQGYTGVYDGQAHGITVNVTEPASGSTVKYGTVEGDYNQESLTCTDAGTYTVYWQVTAEGYAPKTGSAKIVISKAASSVKTAPAAKTLIYTGQPQALITAGTADGGTMQYSTDGTTYGETIPTGTDAKTYTVSYKVVGDANHNDTEAQSLTARISKADPEYTVPTGLSATYGDTLSKVTLPEGWTWADSTASVGNVGENSFKAKFTPTDTANYNTVENVDVTVTVGKADPSVTAPKAVTGLTYTGEAQELITAGTTTGGTMQYSTNGTTYGTDIPTGTNAKTYSVWYFVSGDVNHTSTEPVSLDVTISKANPEYTVPTGLSATYGDTLSKVALPEGWTWADSTASVGNAGSRTFKANFTPTDTANYNTVENVDVTVTVGKANPAYTVPTGLSATYGDTLSKVTLPEGWTWADSTASVGNVGENSFKAKFTPTDTANYNT